MKKKDKIKNVNNNLHQRIVNLIGQYLMEKI